MPKSGKCTSVGMHPADNQTPVSADLLHANLTVFDMFIILADQVVKRSRGCRRQTIGGVEMLVGRVRSPLKNGQDDLPG